MGYFDFLSFKSKEQTERERKEFEARVLPLGDGEKEAAAEVLDRLINRKGLSENEKMFAFISAKDRYVLYGKNEEGLAEAKKTMHKQRWVKPEEKNIIMALVQLESKITTLEEYPADEEILTLAKAMEW